MVDVTLIRFAANHAAPGAVRADVERAASRGGGSCGSPKRATDELHPGHAAGEGSHREGAFAIFWFAINRELKRNQKKVFYTSECFLFSLIVKSSWFPGGTRHSSVFRVREKRKPRRQLSAPTELRRRVNAAAGRVDTWGRQRARACGRMLRACVRACECARECVLRLESRLVLHDGYHGVATEAVM